MRLGLLMVFTNFAVLGYSSIYDPSCKSIPFPSDGQMYVTCKGNFTEMEKLKLLLNDVSKSTKVFKLQDTILDVLPSDIFHSVEKPTIEKVIFDNVSLELLEIPELGDPPLNSVKDTVDSLEIYDSPKVFAWDFPSLKFSKLQKIIIENSALISITIPFFFWPDLRFIQIQNCSVRWINNVAFRGNERLTILSLAHNEVSTISRSMFPKTAAYLYSIDLSFNRLESLPENIFSEMNALQELKLDNNGLKFLDQNLFERSWNNLKMLWLDGNQIPCDSLCWMSEKTEKPLFLESSYCKNSTDMLLVGEYFQDCVAHNTTNVGISAM